VKIADLSPVEVNRRLSQEGLVLRIGPFSIRVQSSIPNLADNIRILYEQYTTNTNSGFVDFHVLLAPPRNLRRWFRPQVLFFFDGRSPFRPLPMGQAFAFFEWGLNWCVGQHAHQYLILHAAVVEKNGRAIIMAAPPETGKSTLCAGLMARGWRLLSDELALITPEDGLLTPIPRPVSLKNKSIGLIRDFVPGATIGLESTETTKGIVAHMKVPDESVEKAEERTLPAWVVCPKYEPGAPAKLERRSKGQTFLYLVENAFNYNILGTRGFETLASLIDNCACYDFSYSKLDEAIEVFEGLESPQAAVAG